jgi:hypothetical protein
VAAAAEVDSLIVVPDQQRQLGPVAADDEETAQDDDHCVAVLGGHGGQIVTPSTAGQGIPRCVSNREPCRERDG